MDQQLTGDALEGRRAASEFALSPAWRMWLAMVLICIATGFLSIILGPDNYWDLRYYHLYAPWAYLHDRYLYDVGPAQEQGFLNPVADLFFYALISSPLNETPRVIAFIMGAVHGINAAMVFGIVCHVIRTPRPWECWSLRAVAWLMGVSGSAFVSLVGVASNDLTSALFVLAALYGTLRMADPASTRGYWSGFAGSGFLAGLGIALKNTSAIYAPGLGLVALMAAVRRRTLLGLIAYGGAAAVAFFAIIGHHMLTLWRYFGNPLFPYMNQIFHSPYFEPEAIRDARFLPHDIWQLLGFPFYWTWVDTYIVAELPFRDWRAAIAYVAMAAGLATLATQWLRGRRNDALAQTPGIDLVYAFVIVSYVCWLFGFAYYRYAVPLEMLTGLITVSALMWMFQDARLRVALAFVLLALAASTSVYLSWGRGHFGDRYVDVHVPPLPSDAVVLVATWDPVAFFIPYANPKAQYVGIENNYLEIAQHNKLAVAVRELMEAPGRPKYVLSVDKFDPDKLNTLLGNYRLKLGPEPCEPIRTNLEGHALSLCRAVEQ